MHHQPLGRNRRRFFRAAAAILAGILAAACTDSSGPTATPTTEFITQLRPWRPGERDSLIAQVRRTNDLVLPFLGNASSYVDQFLPPDSVADIVPNPNWTGPSPSAEFAPAFSVSGVRVPGTGWTTMGLRIREVNAQQSGDSLILNGVLWFNNSDSTWKGFIFAGTPAKTFTATTVNTTIFDAANGKSGVGGGESRLSNGTLWLANGTGSPNTFTISLYLPFGATSTIATGPFLGGTTQSTILIDNINNVGLTRVQGSGTPTTQTASVSGFLVGTELVCLFPTPCSTNVPIIAGP